MTSGATIDRLRRLGLTQLEEMFDPGRRTFVFRRRRQGTGLVAEGHSERYTSITLIGLAGEPADVTARVLAGVPPVELSRMLVEHARISHGIGDVALACWAAVSVNNPDADAAWQRLTALAPQSSPVPVVELSWALSALSLDPTPARRALRDQVAARLLSLYNDEAGTFPHLAGTTGGSRGHVACFADQVYPILALSQFAERTGHAEAVAVAQRAATRICEAQGADGQWWWHYDARVYALVERYPVYSVHQHAMAPMALIALGRVSDTDYSEPIDRGVRWLLSAPELRGGTLVDEAARTVWRKVGRAEPRKASRYLQALATRVRPGSTWPGLDRLLPPGTIDFECRPYEFGWLLYTWPHVKDGYAPTPPS